MTLATVDASGQPSARIVLIKGYDERGFTFFTNYESRKGTDLLAEPRACLLFFWQPLERQVRIEGVVEKVAAEESDAYYHSRPAGSRIGAWASRQSQPITRDELEAREQEFRARYGDQPPRPPHWGGYRLKPTAFEFWQGRPSRLRPPALRPRRRRLEDRTPIAIEAPSAARFPRGAAADRRSRIRAAPIRGAAVNLHDCFQA